MLDQLVLLGNLDRKSIIKRLKNNTILQSDVISYLDAIFIIDISFINKALIIRSLVYILLIKWNYIYNEALLLNELISKFNIPFISGIKPTIIKTSNKIKLNKRKCNKTSKIDSCKIINPNTCFKYTREYEKISLVMNIDFQQSKITNINKSNLQNHFNINDCLHGILNQKSTYSNKVNHTTPKRLENIVKQSDGKIKTPKINKLIKQNSKTTLYDSCINTGNMKIRRKINKLSKNKNNNISKFKDLYDETKISPGYTIYHNRLETLTREIYNNTSCSKIYRNMSNTQEMIINIKTCQTSNKYSEIQLLELINNNIIIGNSRFIDIMSPKKFNREDASKCFIILLRLASNEAVTLHCDENTPIISLGNYNQTLQLN